MKKHITATTEKKVFSMHDAAFVAEVEGWLINKDSFKIELIVVTATGDKTNKYIMPECVGLLNDGVVGVNSQDDITEADDFVRQSAMIASNYRLIGSRVETQSGKKLGKVIDFSFDDNTFYISKIHVVSRFPQRIVRESFIITRSAVVEVQGNTVIIKDARVKAKAQRVSPKAVPA